MSRWQDALLAKGYALVGTFYRENGWVVELGADDLSALAIHARAVLEARHATLLAPPLERTVLVACSMGSVFAHDLAAAKDPPMDGFVTLGGIGAGSPGLVDWVLAFQLAYDAAFGFDPSWGVPGDVRNAGDDPAHPDAVDWEDEVLAVVAAQYADPTQRAKWEFIRLVTGCRWRAGTARRTIPGGWCGRSS